MLNKACYIFLACVCVSLTSMARGTYATTPEGEEEDSLRREYKSEAQLRRERTQLAVGGAKLAETLADTTGGIDYNPFTREFIAKRHSPYQTSVDRNRKPNSKADSTLMVRRKAYVKPHFFAGAYTGVNAFVQTDTKSYANPAITMGVLAGYQFNGLHAVRLSANFTRQTGKNFVQSLQTLQVSADYMFNLSSYLWGSNPNRRIELKPTVGAGFIHSNNGNGGLMSPTLRASLNIAYLINSNSELFVEPYFMFTADRADYVSSPRRYDVQYGVWGGLRVNFGSDTHINDMNMPGFNPNMFVELSTGFQMYKMPGWKETFKRSLGTNYQVSIGKWMSPILGARFTAAGGEFYWKGKSTPPSGIAGTQLHPGVNEYTRAVSVVGRVEVMMRPLNFIHRWREMSRGFDFEMSGGIEAGWYCKPYVPGYGSLNTFELGYTLAANFLYKVTPHIWLFVEPRAQFVEFDVPNANFGHEGTYTDKLFNVNTGIRMQRPTRKQRDEIYAEDPRFHFELGVGGGAMKQIGGTEKIQTHYPFNGMASLYAMACFDNYHAVMLQGDYMRVNRQQYTNYTVMAGNATLHRGGYTTRKNNIVEAKLMYGLNLTNLICKPNYLRRHVNVYGLIGPGLVINTVSPIELNPGELRGGEGKISYKMETLDGNMGMAIAGGFLVKYDFTKHLGVYIQPESSFTFNAHKVIGTEHKYTVLVKVSGGLKYTF